jgi:very-short-patch-repair endonuclease
MRASARRVGVLMANSRARQLRKIMTPQEVKLWVHLRSWKSRGYHFRRQAPRDDYILDFVCLREKVIVEVDGGQHNFGPQEIRDRDRDIHFVKEGFKILRFWNNDIDKNLTGVLETIDRALQNSSPTRPASPATLPLRGRDERGTP